MKTNLRFLAVAAAILSVLSCTREIENIDREEASQTLHYVHFIADAPETKTNLEISQDGTVSYSWTASDACFWTSEGDCRWTITNKTNGETAQEITAALIDGVLALKAGFSSEVKAGNVLFAQYNKSVSSTQNYVSESKYHQESDVMISNEIVVQDGDDSNTKYYFSFKRRVAFAKMTLKGMNPNDYVSKVTIESDKAIAGTYNSETDSFDSNSSNSIVLNDILEKIDENGTATIYFAVVPVEDANLTVTVETVTEEVSAANTYRKTFARPISFVTGDVRAFGVACQRVSLEEIQLYSTEFNYTLSGLDYTSPNEIVGKDSEGGTSWGITYGNWNGSNCAQFRVYSSSLGDFGSLYMKFDLPKVSRVSYKAKVKNRSTNVRLNTYYSVDSGKSWINVDDKKELTNSWTGYEFVVSSKGEYENVRVKFEASGSRNTSSNEELTIDDVVIYGVEYGAPKYNINIETVEGGELSATASSAKAGTEITLVANPDTGYNFNNDWLVKDSDGNEIPVVDEKFTMPAKDVTVTASFSKIAYQIITCSNNRGKISVKIGGSEVTEANYGDEITLSAIPNDGYEFINWSVMDNDNTVVKVTDGKFTMPASPVTVNAYFRSSATYTASFSVNGSIFSTQTYKENDKIVFPENPAENGYQFVGWAKSDLAGIQTMKPEVVNTQTEVMGISNITYYAVFGVIETAVFDASDLSATPAISGQTSTWKHTASGITLTLSDGQHYTLGSPKTFTVTRGTSNYFKISSDNNYTISEIETTISENKYKINTVSSGATLSTSGTKQIVKSDNLTSIQCFATSSSQIRATKITVNALTGYSTKIITLNEVSISGTPTKTEYTVEDAFDPTGLSVTGTYSDGTTSEITEGISWSYTPSTFTASGTQTVSVTATVKSIVSAPYEVNVTVNTITNTLKATNKSIDVNTDLDVSSLFTTNSDATISYTLVENPNDAGALSGNTFTATAAGTYTVKAIQAETTKYSAAEATATITVNTIKLSKPKNLKCSDKTETSLTFTWDAVANASEYQVSTDGGSTYDVSTQTETSYTWTDLTPGTTKTLYVKAIGNGTSYTDSEAAYASGTTKTGGSDWSSTYTSNITLSTSGGNRATSAKVKITNTEYSAMKLGSNGNSGNFTISVPAGATKLYLFAAGWNGKTNTITLSGANVSPYTAQTLTADSGVSGQSTTYTIAGTPSTYFFEFSFDSSSSAQNITISCSERCVVWGVNAK